MIGVRYLRQIKVKPVELKVRYLHRSEVEVVPRLAVAEIVRDPQLPDVLVGQFIRVLVHHVIRHLAAELERRQSAPVTDHEDLVPRYDGVLLPAELLDTSGDIRHLFVRVDLHVPFIRSDLVRVYPVLILAVILFSLH